MNKCFLREMVKDELRSRLLLWEGAILGGVWLNKGIFLREIRHF